jgi:hypothetical protein
MGWVGKAPLLPGECEEPAEQAQGPAARCHRGGGVPAGQLTFPLHLTEACRLELPGLDPMDPCSISLS